MAQASVLTGRFQQVDQNLAQVGNDVGTVNGLLTQVAQLNNQINSMQATAPGSALQLVDQREGVLEQIAGYMPVSVTQNSSGEDQVSVTDANGQGVVLVSNAAVVNTVSLSGGALYAGSPPSALGFASGSLQGALTAGGGAVQDLRSALDQIASQLVTSVNAAYNPSGTPGGDFFSASGTTAGTLSLDPGLNAASLTAGLGGAGNNTVALAVAAVGNQAFSSAGGDQIDGTVNQAYANAVSSIGQALSTANTNVTDQTDVQTIVGNERASTSGVSIDQEMTNLVTYQQAYQASSEVFQVVNEMMKTLESAMAVSG